MNQPNVLITGGNGFLGKAIVKEFLDNDSPLRPGSLTVFDIKDTGSKVDGVEYVQGDILDYNLLLEALQGKDIVIHSAAIVDWGTKSDKEVLDVNLEGTKNVIRACRESGVKYLIFTGSVDAVFGGKPLINVDESHPYPEKHSNSYCTSKYLAEKLILEENDDVLKTCVLRGSDIYGEDDPYHISSLINMAKGGFYVRLGNGKTRCQHIYVGNAGYAHVLAAAAMWNGNEKVCGQVYFMTDGPGSNFFKFFDRIVEGAGYRIWPKNLWLPRGFAYAIGSISEFIAWMVRPVKSYQPKFSRFAVVYTCTDITYSSEKARKDFGFVPKYSEEEGVERTAEHYKI
ncbi:MAG: NAD-dependent epimerase/dehydratase family protein [Bacteroidetes bacterium]|nr:NAD-dependent epimerase/dehydratase family protein [Bacteroidota bacterium]